jgi:Tfp pilus assembly protein PilF
MDKKENDKATAALQKAIEIDPNYNEALYQLGAHLYNLAVEKRNKTIEMDYKDPKTALVEKEAMDLFQQALVPLEKYASQNENDKAILDILYKTNMKLGKIDKAQEYKKRLDALKN